MRAADQANIYLRPLPLVHFSCLHRRNSKVRELEDEGAARASSCVSACPLGGGWLMAFRVILEVGSVHLAKTADGGAQRRAFNPPREIKRT